MGKYPTLIRPNSREPFPIQSSRSGKNSIGREYRFIVDRKVAISEPFILNVGPLGDICKVLDSAGLNDGIRVELPGSL